MLCFLSDIKPTEPGEFEELNIKAQNQSLSHYIYIYINPLDALINKLSECVKDGLSFKKIEHV